LPFRHRPEIQVTITYRLLGQPAVGRLGNQLWEIASTIGIAHRRGERAGFPFWRYTPYFSVPPELFPDLAAVDGEDLGLDYLQDLRYLDGVEDTIRAYFAPGPQLRERIERRNAALLALPHRTSVHVRRADYLHHPQEFHSLPLSYYHEAMALLPPPYLVFSDDLPWCRTHFPPESCVFMEHNRNYEDLFLITMCDAHITSNSTLSWWGAWLGSGPAVYPRTWYGPARDHVDPTLVFPADGIVLDSGSSSG
jgi:hypothetical protein